MEIRNASCNEDGSIDCEIEVREKWVPFTAREDDTEPHGRKIYVTAADLPPAPYVVPEPEPIPEQTPEELRAQIPPLSASPTNAQIVTTVNALLARLRSQGLIDS